MHFQGGVANTHANNSCKHPCHVLQLRLSAFSKNAREVILKTVKIKSRLLLIWLSLFFSYYFYSNINSKVIWSIDNCCKEKTSINVLMPENQVSTTSVFFHLFQQQEGVLIISENMDHRGQEVWSKIFNAIWQEKKKKKAVLSLACHRMSSNHRLQKYGIFSM